MTEERQTAPEPSRLEIAARIMAELIVDSPHYRTAEAFAGDALQYADALIAAARKGGAS